MIDGTILPPVLAPRLASEPALFRALLLYAADFSVAWHCLHQHCVADAAWRCARRARAHVWRGRGAWVCAQCSHTLRATLKQPALAATASLDVIPAVIAIDLAGRQCCFCDVVETALPLQTTNGNAPPA
jgi:hypothetical protein